MSPKKLKELKRLASYQTPDHERAATDPYGLVEMFISEGARRELEEEYDRAAAAKRNPRGARKRFSRT